jgi:hypothetical protein
VWRCKRWSESRGRHCAHEIRKELAVKKEKAVRKRNPEQAERGEEESATRRKKGMGIEEMEMEKNKRRKVWEEKRGREGQREQKRAAGRREEGGSLSEGRHSEYAQGRGGSAAEPS